MSKTQPQRQQSISSKVLKFRDGFSWEDTVRTLYKKDGESNWHGVSRTSLVGGKDGAPTPFHMRYFEVDCGGYSSREKHAHEHVVVVVRGSGDVELGARRFPVNFGDVIYVAPWEVHQFKSTHATEPLGFLCVVPADRDPPVAVAE